MSEKTSAEVVANICSAGWTVRDEAGVETFWNIAYVLKAEAKPKP